jgi:hypothetical protein
VQNSFCVDTHLTHTPLVHRRKIQNFELYKQAYPEYGFVFLGDNGQADAIVAQYLREMHPSCVKATFIHVVQDVDEETVEVLLQHDINAHQRTDHVVQQSAHQRIFYVETWIDAALHAFSIKLITATGVYRVAYEARHEFDKAHFTSDFAKTKV